MSGDDRHRIFAYRVQSHRSGLNRRPLDYESSALPLSYCGQTTDGGRQMADGSCCSLPSTVCRLEMPWLGFEPRRLAAPPPQDGVSTSFTTKAIRSSSIFLLRYSDYTHITYATGATGLEPATSRVTVECSNQTELRPLQKPRAQLLSGTPLRPDSTNESALLTTHQPVAPTGVEPVSGP
jgi:hypothetical protein